MVELLLKQLQLAFKIKEIDSIPPEFETYLFHENRRSLSALTLTWLNDRRDNEVALLNMAKDCYGIVDTVGFRHFWFQVDAEGNSVLMKAVTRKNIQLVFSTLDSIKRIYSAAKSKETLRHLFSHQNKRGETVLYKAVESDQADIMDILLGEAVYAFNGAENLGFKHFLFNADQEGTTPLILASKNSNRRIIYSIFQYGRKNDPIFLDNFHKLLMQQDNQAYSALMRAAEVGDAKVFTYLMNILVNVNYTIADYNVDKIMACLNLKNSQGYTVFQILVQKGHWKLLNTLLDTLQYVAWQESKEVFKSLDFFDETDVTILTRLYREENAFRAHLTDQPVSLFSLTAERKKSAARMNLAQKFLAAGLWTSEEETIPEAWQSLESSSIVTELIDSFFIFCKASPRSKRSLSSVACSSSEEKRQASFPNTPNQQREEAVTNMMAFFTQADLTSVEQIGVIRNSIANSEREKIELTRYADEVKRYYDAHGVAFLKALKAVTSESLENAFASPQPYILIDSGNNLLLLDKNNRLFCSLVSPIEFVPLNAGTTHAELKLWLDTYFSRHYTLHPFDPALVARYPQPLSELGPAIIADSELLNRKYEGVQGSHLRELFLLDGRPIALSLLVEPDFFANYESRLSFRAEQFHELFFHLTADEKLSLKRIVIRYDILPANYQQLSSEENEYLSRYGSQVIALLKQNTHE